MGKHIPEQNDFYSYSYINFRKEMGNVEAKAETAQGLSFALSRVLYQGGLVLYRAQKDELRAIIDLLKS